MTEFEAATISFQEATIAFQNATLYYQQAAIWTDAGVGVLQAGLIGLGLWIMDRTGKRREKREDARHAEAMRALEALIKGMETVIERTAPRRGDTQ